MSPNEIFLPSTGIQQDRYHISMTFFKFLSFESPPRIKEPSESQPCLSLGLTQGQRTLSSGKLSVVTVENINFVQCPLGFATLDKAAALALATSRAVTDLRQYINSDLGYNDLKF